MNFLHKLAVEYRLGMSVPDKAHSTCVNPESSPNRLLSMTARVSFGYQYYGVWTTVTNPGARSSALALYKASQKDQCLRWSHVWSYPFVDGHPGIRIQITTR